MVVDHLPEIRLAPPCRPRSLRSWQDALDLMIESGYDQHALIHEFLQGFVRILHEVVVVVRVGLEEFV
jgi:hypothetical protein